MARGRKGELTRQRVIEQAAPVFNQRGYWGASLRDLMEATGLEKGGIYNHFASKEELAAAAFEHNVGVMGELIRAALAEAGRNAVDRLRALLVVYRRFVTDPPFRGGCPILNTAVDADDTNPVLRDRVRAAVSALHDDTLARVVHRGVERDELALPAGSSPEDVATVMVSTLEGALMLTQLYRDPSYMQTAARHLESYVDSLKKGDVA